MNKKLLIAIAALGMAMPLSAQNWHRKAGHYPFIRYEMNRIEFPGKEGNFDILWHKMDSVLLYGRGNLRIVHIGGSHVQGGTWTQQLRRNLLLFRYGLDGGRGLLFPYAAAGTNTPSGYYSGCTGNWSSEKCLHPGSSVRLGVSGMAVSTSDTAATVSIDLVERNAREWSPAFTFNTLDVLGYGTLEPVVAMDGRNYYGVHDADRGLWHFELPHFTEFVTVRFAGYPGAFTLTGMYADNPYPGVTLSEIGVNGAATGSYLHCADFERDLRLLNPDLVIFSISINDIQGASFDRNGFIARYEQLIGQIERVNPRCAILFTTNNDSFKRGSPNPQGAEAVKAFEKLAKDHRAGLWNLFEIMGGLGSMQRWENEGLSQHDKIHFTPQGYDLAGNLMYNAWMDAYRKHLK